MWNLIRLLTDEYYREYQLIKFLEKRVWKTRKFCLAGYASTGTYWLVNTLLELGIRTENRIPILVKFKGPVRQGLSEFKVHKDLLAEARVGLPSLTLRPKLYFRNDIAVENLATNYPTDPEMPTIIIVRDPRDLFHSYASRRGKPGLQNTLDYARELYPHWNHYYAKCLEQKNHHVVRFEDCKLDPISTMKSLLSWMGATEYSNLDIRIAADASSSEQVKYLEDIFRQSSERALLPYQRFGRNGNPGEWTTMEESYSKEVIENTQEIGMRLGYYKSQLSGVLKRVAVA